jgi:pilus assembly protein Flp/PilA
MRHDRQRGQGLVEYALVLLLIAIVLIFMLTFIGAKLNDSFSNIASGLGR